MEVIFLFGALQAFFFAIVLWRKKNMSHPHLVLFVFFVINGLILLDHYFEKKEIVFEFPHLLGLTYTIPIILGPILWYYTKVLISEKEPGIKELIVPHCVPFIFLTAYFLFDFYFLSAQEKLQYYERQSQGNTSIIVYITEFFLNFSIPFYSVYSLLSLQKHKKGVRNRFSYTEEINLKWLMITLGFFLFISVISLITNLLSDVFPIISFNLGDDMIFASLSVSIIVIGYFGIKQKAIYPSELRVKVKKEVSNQNLAIGMDKDNPLVIEVITMMEAESLYLDPTLSLRDLAGKVGITENHLSQILNTGINLNFYDFINGYRVEEVKRKIKNPENNNLTLLALAYESGFNSKSTFNSIFKKTTGMTPSHYKKSLDN